MNVQVEEDDEVIEQPLFSPNHQEDDVAIDITAAKKPKMLVLGEDDPTRDALIAFWLSESTLGTLHGCLHTWPRWARLRMESG